MPSSVILNWKTFAAGDLALGSLLFAWAFVGPDESSSTRSSSAARRPAGSRLSLILAILYFFEKGHASCQPLPHG